MPYRQNFPIPAVINPPKTCLQIEIPDHPDWKAVISGLLFELTYWFNWERTGDTSGAQCAAVWKQVYNSIDWSDMSCCCEDKAIIIRINPTTGNVEQSSDGGTTWVNQPGGIQSYIVQPVPPVTSGVAATKCDAATNLAGQVDLWITQVTNDFDTAVNLTEFAIAVFEAILAAVLLILSAGALTPLEALVLPTIAVALGAAWGAGKTAFVDYWTEGRRHEVLCAAVCTIGDDGSFTEAQFSAFWNQVNGELTAGPAKMLFMGFLSSVGMAGVNAMAASGMSADSDCADCGCGPCGESFTLFEDFITAGQTLSRDEDGYITVEAWNSGGSGYYVILSTHVQEQCCVIASTEFPVGGTVLFGFTDCNNEISEYSPQHYPALGTTDPVNMVYYNSTGPFTLKILFA